jgi:K+-sensing histidine kinase KdpD
MFGKLEATSQMNTSGVGLGLSICKKIVEALDGSIYLEDDSDINGYR